MKKNLQGKRDWFILKNMLIENILGKNGIIANKLDSYELRPQQLDMALAIEKSIEETGILLLKQEPV